MDKLCIATESRHKRARKRHETRATWFGLRVAADDINKVGEQSVVQPFCNGDDHNGEISAATVLLGYLNFV